MLSSILSLYLFHLCPLILSNEGKISVTELLILINLSLSMSSTWHIDAWFILLIIRPQLFVGTLSSVNTDSFLSGNVWTIIWPERNFQCGYWWNNLSWNYVPWTHRHSLLPLLVFLFVFFLSLLPFLSSVVVWQWTNRSARAFRLGGSNQRIFLRIDCPITLSCIKLAC